MHTLTLTCAHVRVLTHALPYSRTHAQTQNIILGSNAQLSQHQFCEVQIYFCHTYSFSGTLACIPPAKKIMLQLHNIHNSRPKIRQDSGEAKNAVNEEADTSLLPLHPNEEADKSLLPLHPNEEADISLLPLHPNEEADISLLPLHPNEEADISLLPLHLKGAKIAHMSLRLSPPLAQHTSLQLLSPIFSILLT
jgi:hypothetical protein